MKSVKNLRIYLKALELVGKIYKLVKENQTLYRDFSLCDQLKRASVSVPANISEGYARSNKQFKNYLEIAKGSDNEVITLLDIVKLVYNVDTNSLQNEYDILARQITSFSNSF
ncbi:four helix bundle protein [Candidatus Roizmanbacteria bacterium CG_4_8_14_3_um_filter_34_9]|uniref:Four helix bundle protein n=1 Tax=Candidatus Roizmanbacteria bacterium CG_4_8_14_3_um_filter_34_9 TaxID=1974832 RepID=A0A2M7ICA5_9BACT|nr:MAG: four helix bundle protein [Candidatus Roizmanbacteria bacterium CG_4_8_14_3_um_filter_34_9]